jgi:hypothetical protein
MAIKIRKTDYVPGAYARKRTGAVQIAQQYIREWEQKRLRARERISSADEIAPTICFSRKIGVGALEVADIISAIFAMAETGSTIFVGRGAHLFLPRNRVVAVRFICSDEQRRNRLSQILGIDAKEAAALLKKKDREQREFFKKAFGRKEASPYEFDLVINFDYIKSPAAAAAVVASAFREKFRNQRK